MLYYNTLYHRIQLEELCYGILATEDKSQTVQQHITISNNPPNSDFDKGNDTDTPDNTPDNIFNNTLDNIPDNTLKGVLVEQEDLNINQGSFCNMPGIQAVLKRTRSACKDDPPPKYAKVTGGYVLVDSIVAIVEEIRVSYKNKATTALELTKTQAGVAKELYESQVKLACITIEKAVSELIDRYTEDEEFLIQGLELIKNEQSVLIFISLTKVPII